MCSLRQGRNVILPGQYYDAETGLSQNWNRDFDPAVGRYVESDPLGLKAGVNTYAYVKDNPVAYADPTGLDPDPYSHIQCDGNGNYEIINVNKDQCTAACTQAHEQSHINDWKKRYGANSCKTDQRGMCPEESLGMSNSTGILNARHTACKRRV